MPIYVYECIECGLHFEQQQRISDDPIQVCPNCAGQVQRVIQPVRVIFKGSGFYVTDNRRNSSGSARKETSASDTTTNSKSESAESSSPKDETEKSKSEA